MGFNSSTIVVDSTSGSGNSSSNPICFALGTQIKTAQGPALVESLNSDATVIDFNGKNANVKWIGRQRRTPEGLALLKERSPLYKASQIVRPLLIGQGANDPRVNQAESDQIVQAMQSKGIPVTYVLFPDEGHGFAKPENNIAF
ncbi:MAG: hypothetical protein EB072_17355, partial [Betaproteobacteria bacterium]|nr:hypothetical protein [Betaproteobacteria bacterium]